MSRSLVDTIRYAPSPAGVRVHNICDDRADIALLHNEHTGPSDEVVFIESCRDTYGVTNHGGSVTLPVNHLELGWVGTSVVQIKTYLQAS